MDTIETPELKAPELKAPEPQYRSLRKEILETVDVEVSESEAQDYGQDVCIANILKTGTFKIIRWDYLPQTNRFVYMVEWRHV